MAKAKKKEQERLAAAQAMATKEGSQDGNPHMNARLQEKMLKKVPIRMLIVLRPCAR